MENDFLSKLREEIAGNQELKQQITLVKKLVKEGKISKENVNDIFGHFKDAVGDDWSMFMLNTYALVFKTKSINANVIIHKIMTCTREYFRDFLEDMMVFDLLGSSILESGVDSEKIKSFLKLSESRYSTNKEGNIKDNVALRINLYLAIMCKCREYSYDTYMKNSHKIERCFVEHYVNFGKCKKNICTNIVKIIDKKNFTESLSSFVYLYEGTDEEFIRLNRVNCNLENNNAKLHKENVALMEEKRVLAEEKENLSSDIKQLSDEISNLNKKLIEIENDKAVLEGQCDAKCKGFISNLKISLKKYIGLELDGLKQITKFLDTSEQEVVSKRVKNIEDYICKL